MKNLKKYYPMFMELKGLPCLVIGGGKVAERKVITLLSTGASVTVVSPDITPVISNFVKKKRIKYIKGKYSAGQMHKMRLVFGATQDALVNRQIFEEAESLGIPVNIVDEPDICRFIVPANINNRDISVAICTGGAAPGITKLMRKELEADFFPRYACLVACLKKMRNELKKLSTEEKKVFWKNVETLPAIIAKSGNSAIQPMLGKWLNEITSGKK